MIGFGSTVDPYNSYTTLISYTENFIVVPTTFGWKYIPRTEFKDDKKGQNRSCSKTYRGAKKTYLGVD
jgi:hypothetical protein